MGFQLANTLKGIFNLRPPQVILFPTWSVKAVLDNLEQWGPAPATKFCLKLLTFQTLAGAKRISSLSLLTVKEGYLEVGDKKVILQPCGLAKHSRPVYVGGPLQ